jgi:hypothetical protein
VDASSFSEPDIYESCFPISCHQRALPLLPGATQNRYPSWCASRRTTSSGLLSVFLRLIRCRTTSDTFSNGILKTPSSCVRLGRRRHYRAVCLKKTGISHGLTTNAHRSAGRCRRCLEVSAPQKSRSEGLLCRHVLAALWKQTG